MKTPANVDHLLERDAFQALLGHKGWLQPWDEVGDTRDGDRVAVPLAHSDDVVNLINGLRVAEMESDVPDAERWFGDGGSRSLAYEVEVRLHETYDGIGLSLDLLVPTGDLPRLIVLLAASEPRHAE